MATALRPIAEAERLTLDGHLDELRTRLIICVAALVVCTSVCYWQNDRLRETIKKPLQQKVNGDSSKKSGDPLEQAARFEKLQVQAYASTAAALRALRGENLSAAQQRVLDAAVRRNEAAAGAVPKNVNTYKPVTLGVTEPFTQTLTTSF